MNLVHYWNILSSISYMLKNVTHCVQIEINDDKKTQILNMKIVSIYDFSQLQMIQYLHTGETNIDELVTWDTLDGEHRGERPFRMKGNHFYR